MKTKSIFGTLILGFMLIGCGGGSSSNSDNTDNNESNISRVINSNTQVSNKLSPPEWIQGTWMDRVSEPLIPTGFLFTSDDMYSIIGENSVSLMASGIQEGDSITEEITDNRYAFTIHHKQLNSTEPFIFNRINATQINFENNMGGTTGPFTRE